MRPQENIKALADLTRLVRGQLTDLQRKIIAALITIDVHARDILMDLVERRTKDVNDFEWQMQLRYTLENEDIIVRQVGAGEGRQRWGGGAEQAGGRGLGRQVPSPAGTVTVACTSPQHVARATASP